MVREQGPKRTVGLRVDPEIYGEFEDRARLAGKSVSEFLRDLLVTLDSPALRRKRLQELLKKSIGELRSIAKEEGSRKLVQKSLNPFATRVVQQPHEASILADKIEEFVKTNLGESKQGER